MIDDWTSFYNHRSPSGTQHEAPPRHFHWWPELCGFCWVNSASYSLAIGHVRLIRESDRIHSALNAGFYRCLPDFRVISPGFLIPFLP
ncbi:MAG: hypothetical protein PHQ87_03550, partial [Hydrogenophaga sp.]|uniref:hypothetical protein n=1 Tax=Hydrogenophaga sp. TaxID=1904254 RepID=UPI00262D84D1